MESQLKQGMRVRVPWGLDTDREGIVVEVWGNPAKPTQVRVELSPVGDEDERVVLLLTPKVVTPVHAA